MSEKVARIEGFALGDILQLAQTSRMSIRLTVESSHGKGMLFFAKGSLVHAVVGACEGDLAIHTMLDWRDSKVTSSQLPDSCPVTVSCPSVIEFLLQRAKSRAPEAVSMVPSSSTKPIEPTRDSLSVILTQVQESLGNGILGMDIVHKKTGRVLAGIHSSPARCARFDRFAKQLQAAFASANQPPAPTTIKTLVFAIEQNLWVLGVDLNRNYRWILFVDRSKISIALLHDEFLPSFTPQLRSAFQTYGLYS